MIVMSSNDSEAIRRIEEYVKANPDLVEPLLERARGYLEKGDGDSLLMLSAVMVGLGQSIKDIVQQTAVFTHDEQSAKH